MKKIITILLISVLLSGLLSIDVEAQDKISIGVLGKAVGPYWDVVRFGAEEAAKILGIDLTFYVPPTEDIPKQIETVETWISMGFDGIAVAPSDPDALISPIANAMDRGIPVVTIDTDSPKSSRLCYLGTDNYTAGKIAGETMVNILKGKGKVAICTGSLTAMNSLERMQGFRDALESYPEVKIVEPVLCDYEETSKAVELAETALLNNPDLSGFFGVYVFNGPSAANAVKSAGKVGAVHIVGFDTTDEHLFLIKEGVLDAAIGQRQYFMGYLSVVLLYNMIKIGVNNILVLLPKSEGGDVIIDTGIDVVTKENLANYVELLDKWGVQHTFKP